MQTKKNSSKTKIKNSAKKLFFVMSYKDVSMRDVAKMSDMTVGNIYRYYENKDILFEEIVGDTYRSVEKLIKLSDYAKKFIKNRIGVNEKNVYRNSKFRTHILDVAAQLVSENSNELYILLKNSEGSKYEDTGNRIGKIIKETMMVAAPNIKEDEAIIYSFTIISTLSYILKTYIDDKKKLNEMIKTFISKLMKTIE